VFELMREVNRVSGTSFLLMTHNLALARRCERIIEVVDGRIRAWFRPAAAVPAPWLPQVRLGNFKSQGGCGKASRNLPQWSSGI
jgi:ABC-type lipoprotein export system ATPase subunit